MAQERYITYEQLLTSFEENRRLLGIFPPGVYSGFDTKGTPSGNVIPIQHTATGIEKTESDITQKSNPMGIVVTRQGVVISEDASISVNIDYNPSGSDRWDLIVLSHEYVSISGGSTASYSVIKGSPGAGRPGVTNALKQVPIGVFKIPASAVDHTNTIWVRDLVKGPGNAYTFQRYTDSSILDYGSRLLSKDMNLVTDPGLWFINTGFSNIPAGVNMGMVMVLRNNTYIIQVFIAHATGKSWSRGSSNSGSSWTAWSNLNNSDVNASVTNLEAAVGSSTGLSGLDYSSNNYVTDATSLETAIGALDTQAKTNADNISSNDSDITSINSGIGSRTYTEDNYVSDGESLTTSIDALDIQVKVNADGIALKADKDQGTWTEISSFASNVGVSSGVMKPQVRKTQWGEVEYRGAMELTGTVNTGANLFTIPSGFYPIDAGAITGDAWGTLFPIGNQTFPIFIRFDSSGSTTLLYNGTALGSGIILCFTASCRYSQTANTVGNG